MYFPLYYFEIIIPTFYRPSQDTKLTTETYQTIVICRTTEESYFRVLKILRFIYRMRLKKLMVFKTKFCKYSFKEKYQFFLHKNKLLCVANVKI